MIWGGIVNVRQTPLAGAGTTAERPAIVVPGFIWINLDDPDNPYWQRWNGSAWIDFEATAPTLPAWSLSANTLTTSKKLGSIDAVSWDIVYNDIVKAVVSAIVTWRSNHEWRNVGNTATTLTIVTATGSVESIFRFRVLQDGTVTNHQRITVYNINQLINGSNVLCGGIECGTTFFGSRGDTGGAIIRPSGNSFALVTSVGTRVSLFDMANLRWKITDQGDAAITEDSAIFHLSSITKGFLQPRMSTAQFAAIPAKAAGLLAYDNTVNAGTIYDGTRVCYTPKVLYGSATLDFPNTAANDISDLTIAVTGAADGDIVTLGVPAGSTTQGSYSAFVSAADTVTVRFHNSNGGAYDPASGTFKVAVWK